MKIVGINIKRIREKEGLTLRELSKKLDVSASYLSQIETNKTSPSLAALKNIADTLKTTVSSIIGEKVTAGNDTPVIKKKDIKYIDEIGNGISMYLMNRPDENTLMETVYYKLSKNADSGNEAYRHFGQEFVMVMKGEIEIELNEKKYVLKKGDTIYFNSNIPHSFRNLYKGESEVLWVATPPTF